MKKVVVLQTSCGQIQVFRRIRIGDRIEYRRVESDVIKTPDTVGRLNITAILVGLSVGIRQFALARLFERLYVAVTTILVDISK